MITPHVSSVEQIKRFTILEDEWTADSEELTPTLKIKHRVVDHNYAAQIDAMYAAAPGGFAVSDMPS